MTERRRAMDLAVHVVTKGVVKMIFDNVRQVRIICKADWLSQVFQKFFD
jgi:hypothetical protein